MKPTPFFARAAVATAWLAALSGSAAAAEAAVPGGGALATPAVPGSGAMPAAPPSLPSTPLPWAYGTFYRGFGVVGGRLGGRLGSQLGVTVGQRSFALMLGGLPDNRMFSVGVELPRFLGVALRDGPGKLSLLWPSVELHTISDVSHNLFFNVGTGLCGLSYERAWGAGHSFFLQARAPQLVLWLPVMVNGAYVGRHRPGDLKRETQIQRASPFFSLGFGLEAGVAF